MVAMAKTALWCVSGGVDDLTVCLFGEDQIFKFALCNKGTLFKV